MLAKVPDIRWRTAKHIQTTEKVFVPKKDWWTVRQAGMLNDRKSLIGCGHTARGLPGG